jgi:hypothetical protein
MDLFHRSNIPKHFYRPYTKNKGAPLDGKTAGIASLPADDPDRNKFILTSNSININCYYKYKQLLKEDPGNPSLNDALNIIRFEVQCMYRKVYSMSEILKNNMEHDSKNPLSVFNQIVSDLTSENMIEKYFNQIIKPGDYYTLKEAIQVIEAQNFRLGTEQVIIDTLKEINKKGIANTRAEMNQAATKLFYQTLRKLADIGVNPVTIPKSYGIKHIPNLLYTFKKLRESGEIPSYTFVDPFDTIDKPLEESDNHKNFEDHADSVDDDSEQEYEESIVFGWELEDK